MVHASPAERGDRFTVPALMTWVQGELAHLIDAADTDTDEKRAIGALWERASQGKGVFAMVETQVDGRDIRGQLQAKAE